MLDITHDDRCALCVYWWLASSTTNPRINIAEPWAFYRRNTTKCTNFQRATASIFFLVIVSAFGWRSQRVQFRCRWRGADANFVPGMRTILDSFLAILAPLVSVVHNIGVGPCFDGVPRLTHSLGAPFLSNGPVPAKNPCPTLSQSETWPSD